RVAEGSLLERLIAKSIDELTHNKYVSKVDSPDGPMYLFGPGPEITAKLDHKLDTVRALSRKAAIGRIACAILFVVALSFLIALHRERVSAVLGWTGASFVLAGTTTFVGWLIAHRIADSSLASVAATKSLPGSFRAILADVFEISVADFTPAFWIPAL